MKKILLTVCAIIIVIILIVVVRTIKQNQSPTVFSANPQSIAEYPDLPVHPQAKLLSSVKPVNATVSGKIRFRINLSVPEISIWYIKTLWNSGWTIDILPAHLDAPDIQYTVAKKRGQTLQLSVIKKPGDTETEIIVEFPSLSALEEEGE